MKEFRIIRIAHSRIKKDFSFAEALLADYAAQGWQVVSVCPDISSNLSGDLVVTLQRDKTEESC